MADADGLDQNHVVAGGLGKGDGLPRRLGDAAEAVAGGGGADEGALLRGEPAHARLVAEDRAAAPRRGGVDGEHGDLLALGHEVKPELVDQGRFAGARHAADADADGLAGAGQEVLEQSLGAGLVLGLGAFDQGDGAAERHPVAADDRLGGRVQIILLGRASPLMGCGVKRKQAEAQDGCGFPAEIKAQRRSTPITLLAKLKRSAITVTT